MATHLNNSWDALLSSEAAQEYYSALRAYVWQEYHTHTVYPPMDRIMSAFAYTPYEQVKVVILGQDPYHGEGQANGLCFSVNPGVQCPPSLVNIYKALEYDLGIAPTTDGDLSGWAHQGVMLLNSVLTVRRGAAQSHAGKGWERFTDAVIRLLNDSPDPIVFLLWGGYAKRKAECITNPRHCILRSVHPSPLSFYQGFLECRHFSQANAFLQAHGRNPIDWACRSQADWERMRGATV